MPIPAPNKSFKSRLQASAKKLRDDAPQTEPSQAPPRDDNDTEESDVAPKANVRSSLGGTRPSQGQVERTKRRSFLPQPGQSRYSTRSSMLPVVRQLSNDEEQTSQDDTEPSEPVDSEHDVTSATAQNNAKERPRPRSMYQIDTIPPERSEHRKDSSTSRLMRPSAAISKPSEPRTIGLVRSQSVRKPGALIPATSLRGPSAHSQAQPAKTTSANRKDTSIAGASLESSKSVLAVQSTNSKPNGIPTATSQSGTRSSARLQGPNRLASTRLRPETSSTSVSVGVGASVGTENSLASVPKRQDITREDTKKPARPAFSTLQQHFTPRKVGKAPTATFLHPQPAPGGNSLPPEILSLQAQLLQLHLWHASSSQVNHQWEASAKCALQKRFEEVSHLYQSMLEYENAGHEQKNLQSLLEWSGGGGPSAGLIEHIQILSELLHELPSLIEDGGRLQRLVSSFKHWISKSQEARTVRRDLGRSGGNSESVEGLGDSWKAEMAVLLRKLTAYSHDLNKLDQPSAGSSIACVVETCKTLLGGVLDELHMMQTIERDVVSEEKQWIEDHVKMIAEDAGAEILGSNVDLPLWRS